MARGKKTGGRVAGTPNVVTRSVREHFAHAFHLLQQDDTANLHQWAKTNPTEFYRLASKLIPVQLGSDPDSPIKPQVIIQLVPDTKCLPIND